MNCIVDLASVVGGEKTVFPTDKKQAPPDFARQSAFARYRLGIKTRQIAQYKILKLMGKEDTVAMDILREMPFCNSSESSAQ